MNVNREALTTIRAIRAQTDPILVHSPSDSLVVDDDAVPNLVVKERINGIDRLSADEPRRVASWGDTVYHLQKSSLRSSIFVRDFRLATSTIFAFEQFTNQHGIEVPDMALSWEKLTSISDDELDTLLQHSETSAVDFDEEAVMEILTKIRHALAWEQHQLFTEVIYDELPNTLTDSVPKAFWKQPDPVLAELQLASDDEETDNRNQTALADF